MRTACLLVLALGCGARQPTDLPVPQELRPDLDRAATLGHALFDNQKVAARATHALVKAGHLAGDPRVIGLVVRGETAQFIGGTGEAPEVLYQLVVPNIGEVSIAKLDPPLLLDAQGAAIVRARQQAAIAAKQLRAAGSMCDRKYDVVVLPASLIGQEGWLVYLLASASHDRVLAGHHRMRVSADGRQLLEVTPLSRSCVIAEKSGDEASVGIMITQPLAPVPFETHVLTSFMYQQVVLVVAGEHTWAVLGGDIRLIDPKQ